MRSVKPLAALVLPLAAACARSHTSGEDAGLSPAQRTAMDGAQTGAAIEGGAGDTGPADAEGGATAQRPDVDVVDATVQRRDADVVDAAVQRPDADVIDATVPGAPLDASSDRPSPSDASALLEAGADAERSERLQDAGGVPEDEDAGAVVGEVSGSVECGDYSYPETTLAQNITCSGAHSDCIGSAEFRAVGCYEARPPPNPCPAGFGVATLMLIGQWAEAADVTRYYAGDSVCVWTNGGPISSQTCAGETVTYPYCWPRGARCPLLRPGITVSCPDTGPCTVQDYYLARPGYPAPVLCVRQL